MKTCLVRSFIATACIAVCGLAVADGTFRCGAKLIEVGMTQNQVLDLCGEPTSKSVGAQDVRSGKQVVGQTSVHRWTYESYTATRILGFDEDILKSIE